jgi:RimJ/RimL family protein N-acetyltransferase
VSRDARRPDEAEIAVAGVDAWHRRGVGRRLVTAVAERAREVGVRRLTARVLPENAPALRLLRSISPVWLTRHDADALVLVSVLDDDGATTDWTITMDDLLADLAP